MRASMEVRWHKNTWLKSKIEGDILDESRTKTCAALPIVRRDQAETRPRSGRDSDGGRSHRRCASWSSSGVMTPPS